MDRSKRGAKESGKRNPPDLPAFPIAPPQVSSVSRVIWHDLANFGKFKAGGGNFASVSVIPNNDPGYHADPGMSCADGVISSLIHHRRIRFVRMTPQDNLNDDPQLDSSEMRDLCNSLKELSARDAHIQLDSGFPDRVLQAAVDRARDEGLSDEHPLIRVAQQPMSGPVKNGPVKTIASRSRKMAGAMVAIAASIGLALFLRSPHPSTSSSPHPSSSPSPNHTPHAMVSELPALADRVAAAPAPADPVPANSVPANPAPADRLATDESTKVLTESSSNESPMDSRKVAAVTAPPSPFPPSPLLSSPLLSSPLLSSPLPPSSKTPTLSAVMVLEIRQTDSGRSSRAVRRALRLAKITRTQERQVTSEIADAAMEAVHANDEEWVSLLYLQASAKSIDRFYLNLFEDQQGIQSVSLAIATSTPVIDAINRVRIDPTTVLHDEGAAMEMTDPTDQVVGQLDQLTFTPLTRTAASAMMPSKGSSKGSSKGPSKGPDFTAKLLVVIR